MIPDCGDRCQFTFQCSRHLFFSVFPFPVCKAQFIGDWYENRRGAQNTFIFLTIRHSYWRRVRPCAIILADCKEDERVLCASPIFKPIAYKLSISNRRRKYVEEKTTATLKFKQSSIATVRYHLLPVARFPIPLIFRYPLPLSYHYVCVSASGSWVYRGVYWVGSITVYK